MRKRKIERDINKIIESLNEIYAFYGLENQDTLIEIINLLRSIMYSQIIDEEMKHDKHHS